MCYFGFQSDTKSSLFHEVFSQNSFKSLTEKEKKNLKDQILLPIMSHTVLKGIYLPYRITSWGHPDDVLKNGLIDSSISLFT